MKIIREGLSLFHVEQNEKTEDVNAFEYFYKTTMPPIYKVFIETFSISRGSMINEEVFHEGSGKKLNIAQLRYQGLYDEFIGLYDLYSISESIETMKNAYNINDKVNLHDFAPIGECIDNNLLMLGIGETNRDKIYLENPGLFPNGDRLIFISKNIFEFTKNLALVEKERVGYGIESYSVLHKNWEESFWRIKDTR